MALFYQEDFHKESTALDASESQHLAKVLRIKNGEMIEVTDGKGSLYRCEVISVSPKLTTVKVVEQDFFEKSATLKHLAIAPTKNLDRIEWFVEKSVEFGVDELSFLLCQNSERRVLKTDRLKKKAISAMKQSGNLHLPKINELTKFATFLTEQEAENKCIAYVDFQNTTFFKDVLVSHQSHLILIGPEGDFTEEEVKKAEQNGYKKVSLGSTRLRTETAGIAAVHLMNIFCD